MRNCPFIIPSLIVLCGIFPAPGAAQEGQTWPELSAPVSSPTETLRSTPLDAPLDEDTPLQVDAPLQEEGPLFQESNGGLTLQQVIETAERKHPDLAVLRSEIGQANARVTEAGLLPDPEFIGRMESAPFRGETLRQAEYIAGLSQSFPTGNRIAARQQVEVLGRTKKRIDFESTRLAVRMRVQRAFSEALYWDRVAAAHARARSLQNELDLGIRQSHSKLARGVNAAGLLKENVLTDSIQLLKAAEDRYAAGDASMTDVLPVRRDAISLRLNYLDAIREVMEAWVWRRAATIARSSSNHQNQYVRSRPGPPNEWAWAYHSFLLSTAV